MGMGTWLRAAGLLEPGAGNKRRAFNGEIGLNHRPHRHCLRRNRLQPGRTRLTHRVRRYR